MAQIWLVERHGYDYGSVSGAFESRADAYKHMAHVAREHETDYNFSGVRRIFAVVYDAVDFRAMRNDLGDRIIARRVCVVKASR
jgi:hypothetical protein